jgi:hypothetical protein
MNLLTAGIVLIASCLAVNAETMTFVTPAGSTTSGGAVDASATFVTGAGTLSITLTDLLADPGNAAQLISDLDFTLTNGATSGTLASSSGQEITVNSDGTFTLGNTVSTGWVLNSLAGGLQLNVLGTATAPTHLILGPAGAGGTYDKANGSIAGNPPHNPFLNQSATFTLDIAGVTAATAITSATFSLGTTIGANNVPGTPGDPSSVPEPATYVLFTSALGLVVLTQKFRRPKPIRLDSSDRV